MTRLRLLAGFAVLAVATAVALVVVVVRQPSEAEARCAAATAAAALRAGRDSGAGPRVVVIGDSYAVGAGLDDPALSWPSRLPGRVHVAGFSGSGFATAPCPGTAYADRAPDAVAGGADLVVVEGGLNDVGRSDAEIGAGFERLVAALAGRRVLVVGPSAAPAPTLLPGVARVDTLLARLCAEHDVAYLGVADVALTYQGDDVHPDAAGHVVLGDAVAAAVRARWGVSAG